MRWSFFLLNDVTRLHFWWVNTQNTEVTFAMQSSYIQGAARIPATALAFAFAMKESGTKINRSQLKNSSKNGQAPENIESEQLFALKGPKMKPKCEPKRPKWSQKRTKGSQKGAHRKRKVHQNASNDRCSEKVVKRIDFWRCPGSRAGPFWEPFS